MTIMRDGFYSHMNSTEQQFDFESTLDTRHSRLSFARMYHMHYLLQIKRHSINQYNNIRSNSENLSDIFFCVLSL